MKKPETKSKPSKAPYANRGVSIKKEAPKKEVLKKAAVKKAVVKKIAAVKELPIQETPKPSLVKSNSNTPPPTTPSKPSRSRSRKPMVRKKPLPAIPGPQGSKLIQSGKSGLAISRNVIPAGTPAIIVPEGDNMPEYRGRGRKSRSKSANKTGKGKMPLKLFQLIPKQKHSVVHTLPVKKEKMLMRYGKPTKRVLFTVDFLLKASPTILYHFITTPSSLVRWFCDAVDITGEYFTFSWNGNTEVAELIDDIEDERLKFRWLDGEDEEEFFEFRISTADITDETIFEIVDFAWADEVEEQKELWRTQVENLRKETGDA